MALDVNLTNFDARMEQKLVNDNDEDAEAFPLEERSKF